MLLVSTALAGEPERLEIVGRRGALLLHGGKLLFSELSTDLHDVLRDDPNPFAKPSFAPRVLELEPGGGDHRAIYTNFVSAVQAGAPLVADGTQGRMSLELANALIYSSHTGQSVELPLSRAAYAGLLEELQVAQVLT